MAADDNPPETCPVDHKARAAWLEKSKQASSAQSPQVAKTQTPIPIPDTTSRPLKTRPLALDREVSTIPRAELEAKTVTPNPASQPAANHEQETGSDTRSGNWIYPSEKMFFEAMKRKNYAPQATEMAMIVPIHNAVNERAWKEIREWEDLFGWSRAANKSCGGPRLQSFSGDSKNLSPRARWNVLLGYQEPFDRHDWVVERCPGQPSVEYVIDFYSGKEEGKGKGLNFYLDVRPKLNSWEGWKMRAAKFVGF